MDKGNFNLNLLFIWLGYNSLVALLYIFIANLVLFFVDYLPFVMALTYGVVNLLDFYIGVVSGTLSGVFLIILKYGFKEEEK